MKENEAIEALKLEGGLEITGRPIRVAQFFEGIDIAIKALEDVQQYRAIGTVEECRAAVEKQTAIKPERLNIPCTSWTKAHMRYKCTCGKFLTSYDAYCCKCGQMIDWGNEE